MTRGQMTSVLYRLAGLPYTEAPMPYTDISETAYYYDAVCWARDNGIFTAERQESQILRSDQAVTRGEFAAMLLYYSHTLGQFMDTAVALVINCVWDFGYADLELSLSWMI